MVEARTTVQFQLNRGEYGLPENMRLYDVQFNPSDYGIITNYDDLRSIYKTELSPTIITLTTNKESGQQIIKKQILKNKLMDQLGVNFAYTECVVHS